jgi:hypothetical protein
MRVEPPRSGRSTGRSGIGASRQLRRIPAIVSFLNPQPAFNLAGGNRSSCPKAAVTTGEASRLRGQHRKQVTLYDCTGSRNT